MHLHTRSSAHVSSVQGTPHLVLLDTAFYTKELRPLLARWLLLWLGHKCLQGCAIPDELLLAYLTHGAAKAEGPDADPKVVEAVAAIQAGLSDEHMKVMNLSHDWLRTFLPHVIAKINRFKFGLLSAEDLNRALDLDPHIGRNRRLLAVRIYVNRINRYLSTKPSTTCRTLTRGVYSAFPRIYVHNSV